MPENGKCPKILYNKMSDKMAYANSVDPDQTAPAFTINTGNLQQKVINLIFKLYLFREGRLPFMQWETTFLCKIDYLLTVVVYIVEVS